MKIFQLYLENFKSFKSEKIAFCDLMAFIGENNAGKSNALKALDLFFSDTKKLDAHFFNNCEDKIVIQVWFKDLNDEAKIQFQKYLLEDGETVIIKKEYFYDADDTRKMFAVILEQKFENEKDKNGSVAITDKKDIDPFDPQNKSYFWKPNPFGAKSVATGYLPDFLYVPAVKDIKDEAKITDSSRFGQIINTMLTSVIDNKELKKVNEQFTKLLMGENGSQDGRIAQLKDFESMLSEKMASQMKGTTIKLDVAPPSIRDVFKAGTKIMVNDGVSTAAEEKGHGMQRSVIFVIFRAYADLLRREGGEKPKALIFGIEEPELYLHPQMQRAMFALLKEIAKTDQVVFTTHSSFFVDMGSYKSIRIATKDDLTKGTKIIQCHEDIFTEDVEKKDFKLITEFDPERSEMFFGKKVVLVEGDTEKAVLPIAAQKVDAKYLFYDYGITVVECGNKDTMPFFIKVLNAFKIPYVVIYDKDRDGDPDNIKIETEVSLSDGRGYTEILDPDFESVCGAQGVTIPTGRNKPFNSFKVFKELDDANIPARLKEIIDKIFGRTESSE